MKTKTESMLSASLLLAASGTTLAADNLHFYGNLLSKSCTTGGGWRTAGGSAFPHCQQSGFNGCGAVFRVPVVFKLKDCKGPANYQVKITLTGTEDSEQPGISGA